MGLDAFVHDGVLMLGPRVLPSGEVEFAGDGHRATVAMPPIGKPSTERLAVASRPRSAADFAYIVDSLRRWCEASVATGNPVMWT